MKSASVGVIVWKDAVTYGGTSGQYDIGNVPHRPLMMYTAGLIVESSKEGVTIVREISADADCRGTMFIPRGMIVKEIVYEKDAIQTTPSMIKMKMKK